jgi:formyl-CoA transferase
VGSPSLWARFCEVTGLAADGPRFADNAARVRHRVELVAAIEAAFADRDAEPLLAELSSAGVPAGRVRSVDEVYEWEQTRSQGLVVGVDHATLGHVELPGPAVRFFEPGGDETTRTDHVAPPTIDQHGDALRAEFAHAPARMVG